MKKRTSFIHLNENHRDRIHALYGHGHSQKDMANILGVNPSTISRELKRYGKTTWRYNSTKAEMDAQEKRKKSKRDGMKIEVYPLLKKQIISGLKELRSPDEIAGRMKKEKLSIRVGTNAIYKWIYSEYGKEYRQYLCSRRIRKKKQSRLGKRHLIPNRISLRERPDDEIQVHGESDLFVSPINLHTSVVGHLTVVSKAHLLTGNIMLNKSANDMVTAMKRIQRKVNVTTWTMDNGTENTKHEKFGIPTYFCTPGSPWQKPHVECSIGLTRRWFLPKGTNLSTVPDSTFQSMLFVLNHKYRKSLGYRSAYEVAMGCGIIKRIPQLSKQKAIAFR